MTQPVPVAPTAPSRGDAGLGALRGIAVVILALAASGVGLLRFVATDARFSGGVERLLQAVTFAAIALAPAALALMSSRRRVILLVPAAVVLTPLAVLSLAGVLLPLMIPAILLWVAFGTRYDGLPCGVSRGLLAVAVVLALLVAAVVALFAHQDPRSYGDCIMTMTGEGSASGYCPAGALGGAGTSDVITAAESLISLGLVATALLAGWFLAAPRGRRG